jgi:pimeloyl-ACP methyl ester carboxylesterase
MPFIKINGIELYYEDSGSGPETIVFCHGLVCNCRMFDAQVETLKDRYRCVTFDFRGHGKSGTGRNESDMDALSNDAAKLIQKLNCDPCHLLGFSMGGFVALRLAIYNSRLLRSLILVGTSADPMPKEEKFQFKLLALMARWVGFWSVTNKIMSMMFSESFRNDPEKLEWNLNWMFR